MDSPEKYCWFYCIIDAETNKEAKNSTKIINQAKLDFLWGTFTCVILIVLDDNPNIIINTPFYLLRETKMQR